MAEAEQFLITADGDRRNIPVFTVLKNNAILKNIFLLLHAPLDMRMPQDADGDVLVEENETEQILTVGRHPNCSIVLSHPSISRFHLQIRSKPNLGKLSVTDLSSVHGTWVSGKRIRPRDCVELNEGDEMRLGGSSRVYKLHSVSSCQAYDLDNPFCPSSDVIMCDDIQKHDEDLLFPDEAGVLISDDVSLNLEANTPFVSCEEAARQRPVRNDTVLKGILKHKKESFPYLVKPLSFPLTDEERMRVGEVGEVDVEKQVNIAPVISEVPSGSGTECSQMVECGHQVNLNGNLSEDREQMKQLCPFQGSWTVRAQHCSPLLKVCINAEGLLEQESLTLGSEEHPLLAEDQTNMPVDNTKWNFRINDNESGLIENTQSVIKCPTPNLAPAVGQFSTAESGERSDAIFADTCDLSVVGYEAPRLDLTEAELIITEYGERFDAMLMDTCESSDANNEAPKSTPVDAEHQPSKFEWVPTESVSDLTSIHHETDVKPKDPIQFSEIEAQSPQLMVNSAVRLGPRDEKVYIESGNGTLETDSGIQILEPLLNSFVVSEKHSKEGCGFMSVKCESETQSLTTPFSAESTPDNGNQTDSKTVSNQRTNMLSSQRSHPVSTLKILSCSSKVKKRGNTANASSQLRNGNEDEKSVCKIQFDHWEDKYAICSPDKGNCRYNCGSLKCTKKMGILDDVDFSSSNSYKSQSQNISSSRSQKVTLKARMGDLENVEYEVEMYTPDKENFTSNTRRLKSMSRMGLFEKNNMKSSVSTKLHFFKFSNSSFIAEQNYVSGLEKQNNSLFNGKKLALPDAKNQRKAERVPLQSLSNNSSCRSKHDSSSSVNNVATRTRGSVTRAQFQRNFSPIKNKINLDAKVKWFMVVDSASLLNCESRKALTLLQGLRGTKLIVPRTVLRELDTMKHQASFFCRTTEVSAALKWLEDCLVNTKWWIHIQSSSEEARHLPPTPPPSPKLFDRAQQGGKRSWKTFHFIQKISEIRSPKAEDHILECALQQMRSIDDCKKIAILCNDTSLRIKAIAQGFICETATEFRDSLVNPFSERFLWSESSPRGRTWSCHDDIVLRELFYSHESANPSEGQDTVTGLKLILAYDRSDNKPASNLQWK